LRTSRLHVAGSVSPVTRALLSATRSASPGTDW
jgi:hypothetical protein